MQTSNNSNIEVKNSPTQEEVLLIQEIKSTLADFIGEDEHEIFSDLIQTYQNDANKLVNSLRKAVAQGDAKSLRRATHALKSSSGNLGVHKLAQQADELEKRAQANDLSNITLTQFEIEYDLVCRTLKHFS
ncbi:MAG: Hpt domain-containing protein [Thiomargarita sp.]|nr:Hpt domain-containing protein [Thiomargarita sp.]